MTVWEKQKCFENQQYLILVMCTLTMRWCMRALRSSPLLLAPSAADLYMSILCCRASATLLGAGSSLYGTQTQTHTDTHRHTQTHTHTHTRFNFLYFNMQQFYHMPFAALVRRTDQRGSYQQWPPVLVQEQRGQQV